MTILENTESYRKISCKMDILNLVFDLQCYYAYCKSIPIGRRKPVKEHMLANLKDRIFKIVRENYLGLVDFNETLYQPCPNEFEDLKSKFPDNEKVLKLEEELKKLCELIGYRSSLAITLMGAYSDLSTDIEENSALSSIKRIVLCLDPQRSQEEIDYLMNRCDIADFYIAFFIDKYKDDKEALQRNLDDFLLKSKKASDSFIHEVLKAYAKKEIYPSLDALGTLLTPSYVEAVYTEDGVSYTIKNALTNLKFSIIGLSKTNLNLSKINIQQFVKSAIKRYKEDKGGAPLDIDSLSLLLELISKIVDDPSYLKAFAQCILEEEDCDKIADELTLYLEGNQTLANAFTKFYKLAKTIKEAKTKNATSGKKMTFSPLGNHNNTGTN